MNISCYNSIPGVPFAYWASLQMLSIFKNQKLEKYAEASVGMISGDNDRFLRLWHEINITKAYFGATDYIQAFATGKKWFPIQKGGGKRFWYGNLEYLVNYEKDGYELKFKNSINGRVRSHNYNGNKAFQFGITWNSIGTSDLVARISERGFIFDAGGPLCTVNEEGDAVFYLSLLLSKPAKAIFKFINPTINYTPGTLLSLPVIDVDSDLKATVKHIGDCCIENSKSDWNSFETSWDFKKHPLI